MAAASNLTKRSPNDSRQKMIKKIADACEDIKLIYEENKKSLLLELEMLTQTAVDISEKPQFDEKELEQIVDNVEEIKEIVKSRVLPPQDSSAKSSDASDDKPRNTPIEDDEWRKLEMDLEKILENTAVKYKHDDYKNVLDGILKICLLYLAIFPQNATIQKRTLIYWWIGEGIVNATATETAEDVGESYFEKLLEGSWIYAVNNRRSPNVREFKMDPWARWLVIYLAREEEFFNLDKTGMPYSSPSKYRYCLLRNPSNQEGSIKSSRNSSNQDRSTKEHPKGHPNILSVFNVNAERFYAQKLFPTFKEMKSLLVLHLGRWQTPAKHHLDRVNDSQTPAKSHNHCHIEFEDEESELLECLHKLSIPKRLRYLSFAGISRLTELPIAVKKLSHLKILNLRSCQNLQHLGEEIIFLRSLTHLDVSECYMLDHMPKGLGTLSQLEVLKGFIFGSLRSKDPCRLAELAKLEKLRKLSIRIGGEAQIQHKEMTKLKDIKGLRSLAIRWGKLSQRLPTDDKKTFEENWIELSFPLGLEKLDFRCFPKETMFLDPNLKKLKKLYIRGGQVGNIIIKDEAVLKMGVEMIRLKFLHKLRQKWSKLEEWFPHLNYLEIHECPFLEHIPELDKDNVWIKEPTPAPPGIVPTSTDTSVGSHTSEAVGATTSDNPPSETPTSKSLPTSTSKSSKSSSLDTTEVAAPPNTPDRAPIPAHNSSPTTNISSSSPAPTAPSGLAHSTSTTPTSSSLVNSAAVGPLDIYDRAPIPTDNSSHTTNNTSSSPSPGAPCGLAHKTSATPTSSSLATYAVVDPSAIPDNPSCISTNTTTPTPAIRNEDTTLTTTLNTSSSQAPPHPTSPTTDAAHDTPTPTDATYPYYFSG